MSASRLILGMANRSLVVSEPIYSPAPFVPGEHYVEANGRDIPEVARPTTAPISPSASGS